MLWIVVVILLILALGSGPWYSYSSTWGYAPVGGLVFVLLIVLILALFFR